ncbi:MULTISPECIES: site-specific integrase [Bacteroides]|uniref:site-specific integrase n=1 Tax=Bacteroides TaxID=816 RepID=UPI00259D2186|nr:MULTISPECIES: site-specific integrase [Bacteroides]
MELTDVYNAWLPVKRRQVKMSSLACYQLIFMNVLQPKFGKTHVESLSKKVVMPFIYELLDSGSKSVKYCRDILIVLRMLIRFAGDELDLDVPDSIWKVVWPTKNKTGNSHVERYSNAEYRKIVDYAIANPSPLSLGILITICTGMRIGEICALQWKDVDLDEKTIHVSKTMLRIYVLDNIGTDRKNTKIQIGSPKTSSSDRYIPILKSILPIIKKFHAVCNPDYYVCTCSDKYVEPRLFRSYYTDFILEKVKIGHCIKFHMRRHTFASTLIENKMDIKTVSTILGHSDINTTLNIYVHPSEDAKRDAVNVGLKKIFK